MRRTCRGHVRQTLTTFCALAPILGPGSIDARAASDISVATLAIGRLYVIGTTQEPNTPVTLEKRFHTTSDALGRYAFEEIYHPATCIVGVDIEARTYQAVVSNCAQQIRTGPLLFSGTVFPDLNGSAWAPAAGASPAQSMRPRPRRAAGRKPPAGSPRPPAPEGDQVSRDRLRPQ